MGIIAGATIGAGILLTFFFITLAFFLYRRRKGSEYGPSGEQPTPAASRVPSRQGLRVPGGWHLHFLAQVGPETTTAGAGRKRQAAFPVPGRKDVTLRKLDIKVETVNREPLTMHSDREDDNASVSTATRVMKAIYSVRVPLLPGPLLSSHSWDWPLGRLTLVPTHTCTHIHTHKCSHAHWQICVCTHARTHFQAGFLPAEDRQVGPPGGVLHPILLP